MHYRILILSVLMSLNLTCQSSNELLEVLLECQDISLTWKGEVQVAYDPETFQLGYNSDRHEYRVYDDRLAYWFVVSCSEQPVTEGQVVTADVSWTGVNNTHVSKGIELTVKKTDPSGNIWLWNQVESIGIILKNQ